MRIVSQNGKYDASYEQCIISVIGGMITAEIPSTNSSTCSFLMGEYSSPEKAQKVMEMLRMGYVGLIPSLIISDRGVSPADLEELKQSMVGRQIIQAGTSSVEYHMLPRIFHFPTDEEVEVEE